MATRLLALRAGRPLPQEDSWYSFLLEAESNAGVIVWLEGYINWFHGYLTKRESCVLFTGIFPSPFLVVSSVPQGSVSEPLLFNIFINDLCEIINHSSCLLLADDLKVYRAIKSPNDCFLLQSDIERVHEWFSANLMKPNLNKIRVISFSRKIVPPATVLQPDVFLLQIHFVIL
jgi:hypothetical protein